MSRSNNSTSFTGKRKHSGSFLAAHPASTKAVSNNKPSLSLDTSMSRVAAYARYSTELQRETSIDDQFDACRRTLTRQGCLADSMRIFKDEAISGKKSATASRTGYQNLLRAIKNDEIDVLVCDQQCRLARSATESLSFFEELKTHKVRLITADGFDSDNMTAELLYGIKSIFNAFFLEETRHRVQRAMSGDFERGAMITSVPFGYSIERREDGVSKWVINEKQAAILREIYKNRREGMSLSQIAAILNVRGIPTPAPDKVPGDDPKHWRTSALWRMVGNSIYYGLYTVRLVSGKDAPGSVSRFMPELAIVSHEEWLCAQTKPNKFMNSEKGTGVVYGGVKHLFTGLIACGTCGCRISVHGPRNVAGGTLNCIQCENANREGVSHRPVWHLSVKGVRHMLQTLLMRLMKGDTLKLFHEKLRERIAGGRGAELIEAKASLNNALRVKARLIQMIDNLNLSDEDLTDKFQRSSEQCLLLQRRVADLEIAVKQTDLEAIQVQLRANVGGIVDQFLRPDTEVYRANAILKSVFPKITLIYKPNRYTAIFEVYMVPGAAIACVTDTPVLVNDHQILYLCLVTSGSKYPSWTLQELTQDELTEVHCAIGRELSRKREPDGI